MITTIDTSAYQMPLFEQYPLSVEFDRHKEMIERCFAAQPEKYRNRDEAMRLGAELEICPIELRPHDLTIEHEPEYDGKGNIRGYCCTARAGFIGDPELWLLYPFELPEPMPEGEIFRQQLIISLHASTTAEGEAASTGPWLTSARSSVCRPSISSTSTPCSSSMPPRWSLPKGRRGRFGAVLGHPPRLR